MDIKHLDEEEILVELETRNIQPNTENALEKLTTVLADEEAGRVGRPEHPHRCNKKLRCCMGDFETAKRTPDRNVYAKLISKTIHLIHRFERLAIHAQNLNVSNSLVQAKELLNKIKSAITRSSPDSSAEFAGFSANDMQQHPNNEPGAAGGQVRPATVAHSPVQQPAPVMHQQSFLEPRSNNNQSNELEF